MEILVNFSDGTEDRMRLDESEGLAAYRRTAAHVLAQAVKRLYGEAAVRLGTGAASEDGFYYDLDLDAALSGETLTAIEGEMGRIIRENLPIVRKTVSRKEAEDIFAGRGEQWKLELLAEHWQEEEISLLEQGEFTDLCSDPLLPSTGGISAWRLLHTAGAYWQGNSGNRMLQRIYGIAFPKKEQLEAYLLMLEEAKLRDHRKLGRELELFMFSEEAPGMPFFLPKGMTLRTELENFMRKLHQERGYEEVRTPLMLNNRLWEQSGHWDHYKDNMYFTQVDETRFALKPMNCPGHMLIFGNGLRSYRDLPLRLAEFGQVHRHEFSGALNGMMRVRTFCQDDAHLFVLPAQIEEEIGQVITLIDQVYRVFGFEYRIELSTRPEDSMGSSQLWEQAEAALENVLKERGIPYRLNQGDGAFYGPKIDFHITDALKRSWQCGTIQLDFQMPEKFDLSYVGEDNGKHRPVVIHRAVYGSIDRFMGILTEHYAGAFPLWLAPVQVKLLPVSKQYAGYADEVQTALLKAGIRAETDAREEKLGYRIREAELGRVPYMFILGAKEQSSSQASVRSREAGDMGLRGLDEITSQLLAEVRSRG